MEIGERKQCEQTLEDVNQVLAGKCAFLAPRTFRTACGIGRGTNN
jgi:hypothetical protein